MEIEQIQQLIDLLEKSKLKKISYKKGDFELGLEKETVEIAHPRQIVHVAEAAFQHPETSAHRPSQPSHSAPIDGKFVQSPMVGTFYASPSPDQAPFVKVGDRVQEGQVVCIIEAMKVMNEVKANISGQVAEVLVHNAQPVEFGTKLIRIV